MVIAEMCDGRGPRSLNAPSNERGVVVETADAQRRFAVVSDQMATFAVHFDED
jgi:hypothetical protein